MIEGIAMLTVLAGMGIYFVKSTDLPKDMKARSEQMRQDSLRNPVAAQKKFNFPTATTANANALAKTTKLEDNTALKKAEEATKLLAQKRLEKIALIDKEIDTLTLTITALEQELRANNARNAEIQAEIDRHLETLARLEASKIS
nr:hypothetical protein BHI3_12740 [Bacteriovorax sp. HI3]